VSTSTESKSVTCPFCNADGCQLISLFGSQLLLSQYRCKRCGSYFEAIREPSPSGSGQGEGGEHGS
jgi:transposase-like protein